MWYSKFSQVSYDSFCLYHSIREKELTKQKYITFYYPFFLLSCFKFFLFKLLMLYFFSLVIISLCSFFNGFRRRKNNLIMWNMFSLPHSFIIILFKIYLRKNCNCIKKDFFHSFNLLCECSRSENTVGTS
jgi:uncharacterized membrane protein